MTFSKYTEKSEPLFKSLKMLDIFEFNRISTAVSIYPYYHDNLPAFLGNLFKTNKSIHSCNTQSAPNMHIEFRRTNYAKIFYRF